MDKQEETHFFTDLKKLVVDYLQNRLELAKMSAYEKIAKLVALLFSGIFLTILLFFTILFISLMGGFYFSNLFHNTFYGFSIIAAFYLILFVVLFVLRKSIIEKFIIDAVIKILFDGDDE